MTPPPRDAVVGLSDEETQTVTELRAWHRTAPADALADAAYVLALTAIADQGRFVTWRSDNDNSKHFVHHGHGRRHGEACRCTCRARSVGMCITEGCGNAIVSVEADTPRWCSNRCYQRWHRATRSKP